MGLQGNRFREQTEEAELFKFLALRDGEEEQEVETASTVEDKVAAAIFAESNLVEVSTAKTTRLEGNGRVHLQTTVPRGGKGGGWGRVIGSQACHVSKVLENFPEEMVAKLEMELLVLGFVSVLL